MQTKLNLLKQSTTQNVIINSHQPTQHNNESSQNKPSSQQTNLLKKSKSGVDIMKNYLIRKAQNMYKLNLSDQQAFKWKFNKNKNNRPLSSFRLINKQSLTNNTIVNAQLEDLKDFSFPVLAYKTKQLASFAITILKENTYFKQNINDEEFLRKLITQVSMNYNIVSYHNFSHAFSLSLMLFQAFEYHEQLSNYYTQEDKYYAMLAGFAHDMNHPGTNNAFEVKTKSARAIEFNNQSVLENFHLKQFWRLLQRNPEINFLNRTSKPQQIKKRITYLILMTDVAQHFKNLEKLKALRIQAQDSNQSMLDKQQNRQFFLGQLFHASDIGNPCIDFQNYISWAALLSHQFNEQTKLEKQNQVEVTQMLKYKDLTTFYKGQLGFINFMVYPLWKQISQVCSGLKIFTENIQDNKVRLNEKIQNAIKEEEHV